MQFEMQNLTEKPKQLRLVDLPVRQAYVNVGPTGKTDNIVYKIDNDRVGIISDTGFDVYPVSAFCGLYLPFTGELRIKFVQGI